MVVFVVKGIQVLVCSVQAAEGAENYFVFHFVSCSAYTRSRVLIGSRACSDVLKAYKLALRERAVKP